MLNKILNVGRKTVLPDVGQLTTLRDAKLKPSTTTTCPVRIDFCIYDSNLVHPLYTCFSNNTSDFKGIV